MTKHRISCSYPHYFLLLWHTIPTPKKIPSHIWLEFSFIHIQKDPDDVIFSDNQSLEIPPPKEYWSRSSMMVMMDEKILPKEAPKINLRLFLLGRRSRRRSPTVPDQVVRNTIDLLLTVHCGFPQSPAHLFCLEAKHELHYDDLQTRLQSAVVHVLVKGRCCLVQAKLQLPSHMRKPLKDTRFR